MATKKPMVKVTLDPETLQRIEEYQKRNGYPDRSMTIHELVIRSLDAALEEPADPTPKIHRREKRNKDGDNDET